MAFKLSNDDSHSDDSLADINVVPLVDVMLVLLIIFMVTAPLSIGGINVALPKSRAKSVSVDQDRIVLSVDAKGLYFIDSMRIPAGELEGRLKAIFEFRNKKNLYIRADRTVPYGRVVDAMSAAKIAGVNKMSMLTEMVEGKKHAALLGPADKKI